MIFLEQINQSKSMCWLNCKFFSFNFFPFNEHTEKSHWVAWKLKISEITWKYVAHISRAYKSVVFILLLVFLSIDGAECRPSSSAANPLIWNDTWWQRIRHVTTVVWFARWLSRHRQHYPLKRRSTLLALYRYVSRDRERFSCIFCSVE